MENLTRLLGQYQEDKRVKVLSQKLSSQTPERILLSGCVGAGDCFVLTALQALRPTTHLIIEIDKEAAAYRANTLSNIMQGRDALFFPDSFKQPGKFEVLNKTNILLRTETMNKMHSDLMPNHIIVTYPEALFEQVVSPAKLESDRIIIRKKENINIDDIIHLLIDFGFANVDFVYEPGQFSIRGGIVDIFSYGNEWPYRVELFDDEVESIRTFDPLTQLSQQNIQAISIIPNVGSQFSEGDKVSLLAGLPENTIVWIRDLEVLIDKLQMCFEKANEINLVSVDLDDESMVQFIKDKAFVLPSQVSRELNDLNVILQTSFEANQNITQVTFDQQPQPNFNKNFKLLIEDLQDNERKQIENFIFSTNTKQIERFYRIFEDLNANVHMHPIPKAIHEGFIDPSLGVACYTDHQIFARFHKYNLRKGFTREQAMNLKMLRELVPGDFVTHIDHGVGRYSGLEKININGHVQESVRLIYKNNDLLYVSIHSLHKISKFVGKDGTPPALSKLGSDTWAKLKSKTKKKVKDIAKELIKLYAARKASEGNAFPPDGYLQNELEASFIYEDTPDQETATADVKEDMMKAYPMDRLICGDVGFGKTEIAIRAAFKAIMGGKQVAVLVPTTILALQHQKTFNDRLSPFGATVDYINRFRSTKEKNQIYEDLKAGKIDLVIGTHGLLNKKIGFKDLGLLIIDEEQKFGVSAKEKLRKIKVNVDTLTLTATPIPRTLQFSLMAARDLSIIRTPPPNRQPIHTERRMFSDDIIRDAIYYETNRGGQVFFVHNRVKSLPDICAMITRVCPDLDIAMAHGQMDSTKLEKTLVSFIDNQYDVLVCTNIIETGLDIANANTIIINNAHQFGLSDLHQLRGRVGRSNKKAFCYLFTPPLSALTKEARKRIRTIEEFSDLGSGFDIAMKDLDIRGAGNLLGGEQSGFISDIGYETYQKILEEAIQELKETDYKDLFKEELERDRIFVRDVEIDTDVEMLIPDKYVSSIDERLRLYSELDQLEDEKSIDAYRARLQDRFGPVPEVAEELFEGLRLRWICKEMGFYRLSLKNDKLIGFFVKNAQSSYYEADYFKQLLAAISVEGKKGGFRLKQSRNNLLLINDNVRNLRKARELLLELDLAAKNFAGSTIAQT